MHGLVALMELTASRAAARTGPSGEPVLLGEQDRTRWDRLLIHRGVEALGRAEAIPGKRGPYTIQAGIAACHARAPTMADTDWARIASLYDELAAVAPSPVVALIRAVAVGRAAGPEAGLALVEELAAEPSLQRYHRLPAVRADLLERLGRREEARAEFRARGVAHAKRARARRPARPRPRVRGGNARAELTLSRRPGGCARRPSARPRRST